MQDLPTDPPRFVINATNVQTGALFRFSRPYLADYRVGRVLRPRVELAVAVAASSAFPPVLSPLTLKLDPTAWAPASHFPSEDLHQDPYLREVVLTDGGVYDNLGLETAWKKYKTILVSNGGGKLQPEPEPKGDWARHGIRINDVIDNQVRSLRVRQVIAAYVTKETARHAWGFAAISRIIHRGHAACPWTSPSSSPTADAVESGSTTHSKSASSIGAMPSAMRPCARVDGARVCRRDFYPMSGVG